MARPKIHADKAAKRAAYLADKDRFDFVTSKVIGDTVRELAATFGATNSDVLNDLVRFALLNRNWKQQGLLWSRENKQP